MIVQRISSHTLDALNRLLTQYQGRPLITGFYSSFTDQIQDLEDAIFALDEGRQLWDGEQSPAFGKQLDNIGEIVGISRNGLADAEYLLFIFGKISENYSDATIPTIENVIRYVFQAQKVLIQEIFPAGISIQILGTPIAKSLYPIAVSLVRASLGAGINLVFTAASPYVNVFRFAGSGVNGATNGFSDIAGTTGGVFIGLL